MSSYNIATRYANALMQLATEKEILEQVSNDMEIIYDGISSSKELRTILKSPVIKTDKKQSILTKIFDNKISDVSSEFIQFILKKNREELIHEIIKRFRELYNLKINRVEAEVISSIELTEQQKKELHSSLIAYTQKEVLLNFSLDESLIGGFIVKINDTVLDSSVKQQLGKLRKKLFEQQHLVVN